MQQVLAAPVGTLQQSQTAFLVDAIHSLCRTRNSQDGGRLFTPLASIRKAEALFRRLLEEAESSASTATTMQIPPKVWSALLQGLAHMNPTLSNDGIHSNDQNKAAFLKARDLLYEMLSLHKQNPQVHSKPTEYHCSTVLLACANHAVLHNSNENAEDDAPAAADRASSDCAIETAENLLAALESPESVVAPTANMYHNILLAHANRSRCVYGAATAAENWLLHVSQRGADAEATASTATATAPLLDTASFNRVLKAWSETPDATGAARAHEILQLMMDLSDGSNRHVRPDEYSFGTVVSAYGQRGQPEKSEEILKMAVDYFNNLPPDVELTPIRNASKQQPERTTLPDLTQCWTATCFAWANNTAAANNNAGNGRGSAPERIQALLEEIDYNQRGKTKHKFILQRKRGMYAAWIQAHLQLQHVDPAEHVLRQWVRDCIHRRQQFPRQAQPTAAEFESVQNGWLRHAQRQRRVHEVAAERATELLQLMLQLSEQRGMACAPRIDTFEMCIVLWTNACQALLREVEDMERRWKRRENRGASAASSTDGGDDPTTAAGGETAGATDTTTHTLSPEYEKLAKQKQDVKDQAMTAALKSVELLDLAEARKLSRHRTYKFVIHRLCDVEDAHCTHEAVNILRRLERETEQRNLQWPSDAVGLYNRVLSVLGRDGSDESCALALEILKNTPRSGPRAIRVETKTYTAVVSGLARVKGKRSARTAYEIFEKVKALDASDPEGPVKLDPIFFEQVFWSLNTGEDKVSAGRSCEVLNYMLNLHFGGREGMEPTKYCLNACIDSLVKCQDRTYLVFAIDLLRSIIQQYDEQKLTKLPSFPAFLKIIRSCREDGAPELVQRATEFERDAKRLGLRKENKAIINR